MGMDKVAPKSVYAKVVLAKIFTLLGLILNVGLVVFEELMGSMSEFAAFLIRTKA